MMQGLTSVSTFLGLYLRQGCINLFTTNHFAENVPGTPAVSKMAIFLHKMVDNVFNKASTNGRQSIFAKILIWNFEANFIKSNYV